VIIKGRAVGDINHWARYLRQAGENEKVIEHEIRGAASREKRRSRRCRISPSSRARREISFIMAI